MARSPGRTIARRTVLGLAGLGGAAAGALALELVAAGLCYGAEYPWRLLTWREYPSEWRFPARGLTASPRKLPIPADPESGAPVRAAFASVSGGAELGAFAERTATTSLLVLRDGRLVLEAYFNGARRDAPQTSFSVAKSVTSALVGAALADGVFPALESEVTAALPDARHLRGSSVRIEHLLRMSSGFELHGKPVPGPFGTPWSDYKIIYYGPYLREVALSVRPAVPPATRFLYDDRNPMLLGLMLERRTSLHVARYLEQRLWHPLGAEYPASWNLDSRADGFERMESGLNAAPLDYAKFGLLYLNAGRNQRGERVLPESWVAASLSPGPALADWAEGADQSYGFLWWLFPRPDGPADAFAHGIMGQVIYVSRARNLVIVRTGTDTGGVDWPRFIHRWAGEIGTV